MDALPKKEVSETLCSSIASMYQQEVAAADRMSSLEKENEALKAEVQRLRGQKQATVAEPDRQVDKVHALTQEIRALEDENARLAKRCLSKL
uniref:Uncharacterized protein n=1 Tax=Noctiluca scintillans TaxID=2966 RepID=A0A7S0ZXU5_NOCSC|eukprot:CAMPEP_0194541780 /NCGR_PEP_ID=MMETSP0253-20130528/82789_1 /TAXON_ID=2966 /ORGANISM="Noctiluca scintillans" /LENGTH=91 /DNA_ID=CAMNT_0039388315 /DNA_START=18 /DNA_END=293 /DNA_ORIENTATION=-